MSLLVSNRPGMKCLRHGEEAPVCERGADESLLHTEVFEAVEEARVRHLHDAAAERVHLSMNALFKWSFAHDAHFDKEEEENDKVAL